MIFDTDIFIWTQRGNENAAKLMEKAEEKYLSTQTYMELLQAANNKKQHDYISNFLREFGFHTLPLTESIGHRAAVYVEEYSLSRRIRAIDAIIAATATENHLPLCSGNAKHFKAIQELKFKLFRP